MGLFMMYSYTGDCSSAAAQAAAKQNLITLCGDKCKIEDVTVSCGAADAVSRRKRRNVKQLTLKVTIKVTTSVEKARGVCKSFLIQTYFYFFCHLVV